MFVFALLGTSVGLMLYCSRPNDDRVPALRQAATEIEGAEHRRAAAMTATAEVKSGARAVEGEANAVVSRAAAARRQARVVGAEKVMVSALPDEPAMEIDVPAPVVERMRLDSSAVAALGTLVRWKDRVVGAQEQRIAADSVELLATSKAFTALERVKEPRCGRRCGIILGVGGMLATAVAVEQVRKTFR
jgi:hypothetical protein